ncbi:MAG: flavin reductase family protein [Bacteroidales bacterium]|nr:flavin reductase family protein [Bacteroidales bacterium]
MAKIAWEPGTVLYPLPVVMVTCGTMECPNIITVAWTGIVSTTPPRTYVSIRPERHSHGIIKQNMEFTINLVSEKLAYHADFCGVRSGRHIDKFKTLGLTPLPGTKNTCPCIAESPLSLECKVFEIISVGSHDMFLADIVQVIAEESLFNRKTQHFHIEKEMLVGYLHGGYYTFDRFIGRFGFSVKKKKNK